MKKKKLESGNRILLTSKDGITHEGIFITEKVSSLGKITAIVQLDGDIKVQYHNFDRLEKLPDKSYDITNAKSINGGYIMPNGDFVSEDAVNMNVISKSL